MSRLYTVWTKEGRSETATSRSEANLHWDMLEENGYTPEEITEV